MWMKWDTHTHVGNGTECRMCKRNKKKPSIDKISMNQTSVQLYQIICSIYGIAVKIEFAASFHRKKYKFERNALCAKTNRRVKQVCHPNGDQNANMRLRDHNLEIKTIIISIGIIKRLIKWYLIFFVSHACSFTWNLR